jgi:hypothetical protein
MKPTALLLALALLTTAGKSAAADKPFDPPKLAKRVQLSLVQVTYPDYENDKTHVCAGFVVDTTRGRVMTAQHCVPADGQNILVDGLPTEVVAENGLFALLSYPPLKKPVLELRKDKPDYAEPVLATGYGMGMLMTMVRYVAAFDEADVGVDGAFIPGMSGGPVVDSQGRVVFIIQASANGAPLGVGCSSEEMRAFLKSVR